MKMVEMRILLNLKYKTENKLHVDYFDIFKTRIPLLVTELYFPPHKRKWTQWVTFMKRYMYRCIRKFYKNIDQIKIIFLPTWMNREERMLQKEKFLEKYFLTKSIFLNFETFHIYYKGRKELKLYHTKRECDGHIGHILFIIHCYTFYYIYVDIIYVT